MGEQVRAFQAEGTAWTKIMRQETAWRMLAEETKGGGQGLGWAHRRPQRGLDPKP